MNATCSSNGQCLNTTGVAFCFCNPHFNDSVCSTCEPLYYGPNCSPCLDCGEFGTCNDGISNDGKCDCEWNYAGKQCSTPWFFYFVFSALGLLVLMLIVVFVIVIVKIVKQRQSQGMVQGLVESVSVGNAERAPLL